MQHHNETIYLVHFLIVLQSSYSVQFHAQIAFANSLLKQRKEFVDVLLTMHLSIFILVINQLDAQNLFYNKFISCLYMFRAPCAHRREVKLYYTASGIITPIGGRPMHRLREDSSLNL